MAIGEQQEPVGWWQRESSRSRWPGGSRRAAGAGRPMAAGEQQEPVARWQQEPRVE